MLCAGRDQRSGVRLSIGGTGYDPTDPMGKMTFDILATCAAQAGEHRLAELAELFSVSRATIYREIARPDLTLI